MNTLNGVVLCGGRSVRMNSDKCLLDYHGSPQWSYIYNLISGFCRAVYISCNGSQLNNFNDSALIVDDALFSSAGPMTGVLSALNKLNDAILVVGCDYPFITKDVIEDLISRRNTHAMASCAYNSDADCFEPMICIYERKAFFLIYNEYISGRRSLQHFLRESNALKVHLKAEAFSNVNTAEEFTAVRKLITV